MNIKYLLGSIIAAPLLPIMYFQGKRIKKRVPSLPEATGSSGSTANSSNQKLQLITIGESTIAGVGVETHEQGFTGALARTLGESLHTDVDWRVYARSGYTIKQVTKKIIPKIEEEKLDLIVIGMGGNDAFELNSPRQCKMDLIEMIATLRNRFGNIPIVFNNMPPIKDFPAFTPLIKFVIGNLVEFYGEKLDEICSEQPNVYFASEIIKLSHWIEHLDHKYTPDDFFSDGVHPSKLSYQTWGSEMAKLVVTQVMK